MIKGLCFPRIERRGLSQVSLILLVNEEIILKGMSSGLKIWEKITSLPFGRV